MLFLKAIFLFLLLTTWLHASTLHLAISANPSRLNPLIATDSSSATITDFIFSSLVKYDKDAKNIVGDLAQNYYFEDNRTIIFNLKKNVQWHDGAKFSARDVKFTFDLIRSKKIVSAYTSTFRIVESVDVLDDYTLRVKYKKPYFKALETWMMGIVPEHILKDENDIMSSKFNTNPIGTGPYTLSKMEFGKTIELSAFKHYYETPAKIEKISFTTISDPLTKFLMLKDRQLDIDSLDAMQYDRQVGEKFFKNFKIVEDLAHAYTYLGFNLKNKKFQDPKVREALSLAIDRNELINILFFKYATTCSGPFLPGSNAFNKAVKPPKQNIKRAKELLAEAGYSEKNPLTFEIATSNSNSIRPYAAEILQLQLQKVGVHVKLRVMEWQAFLNMVVFPRKFDTVLLGWSLSLNPDPYLTWHSDSDKMGGFNFIGYKNEEVDRLIEKMQGITNIEKLSKVQQLIFKKIVDDNPYLFLFIPSSITAYNKNILNVKPSIQGIWHNYIEWEKSDETYIE